jgi:Molecular chaperone (small heat shock protein)
MALTTTPHPSIVDVGSEWVIVLGVADFTPAELRVEFDHGMLTVRGNRDPVGPFDLQEHFEESLHLPPDVDIDRAVAHFRPRGVLEIRIRKAPAQHRVIPIEYEGGIVHGEAAPC